MKARPVIVAALTLGLIAVGAGGAVAAPAVEEYIPRVPKAKGADAPSGGAATPGAEATSAPRAIADDRPPGYRPVQPAGSVEPLDDRSVLSALLDALLDPIVIAVALAALAVTAAVMRLRPAT